MSSRRTKREPRGDKYADKVAAIREVQASRAEIAERRAEKRRRRQQGAVTVREEQPSAKSETLADWELELIAQARTGTGNQTAPPMSDEEWGMPMVYTTDGARPESVKASPEEHLLRSIFAPTPVDRRLIYSVFGDEMTGHASFDAEREVGAGYELEDEYSR